MVGNMWKSHINSLHEIWVLCGVVVLYLGTGSEKTLDPRKLWQKKLISINYKNDNHQTATADKRKIIRKSSIIFFCVTSISPYSVVSNGLNLNLNSANKQKPKSPTFFTIKVEF